MGEEILDDRGDRGVPFGGPNPRLVVGFVADGYSDVSHGLCALSPSIVIVLQGKVILCKKQGLGWIYLWGRSTER